ncbi:MAG: phytoene/squalene synthase family protein [Planctomycetota bacterium]
MGSLGESYAWCREICHASKSSFYSSFALLSPDRRNSMFTLYAFARISDDLADEPMDPKKRQELLDAWRQTLGELEQQQGVPKLPDCLQEYHLLWPALDDTMHRFQMPISLLDDIVEGVMMDVKGEIRLGTWQELDRYCYYVASAVGLACTYIWRDKDLAPQDEAVLCGQAFQLTNILRDVAEDATRGRIYLPAELLVKHGVSEELWLSRKPNGNWQELIGEVVKIAEDRYLQGWSTIDSLSPDSQRMFSLIWRIYRQLLRQIDANLEQLWTDKRVRLQFSQKVWLSLGHFVPGMFRMLPAPKGIASKRTAAGFEATT